MLNLCDAWMLRSLCMFGKLHQLSINTSINTIKVFFHGLFSLMHFKQSLREVSLLTGSRNNIEDMSFGVGRTQLSLSWLIFFISTGNESSCTVMGRVLRVFVCINPILLLQKNIQGLVIYEVKRFTKFPILVAAGLHFFKVSLAVSQHRKRQKENQPQDEGRERTSWIPLQRLVLLGTSSFPSENYINFCQDQGLQ